MTRDKRNGPGVEAQPVRRSARWTADGDLIVRRRAGVAELCDLHPRQLAAWRAARAHLLAHGLWPAVPGHVERALRRRGWWTP